MFGEKILKILINFHKICFLWPICTDSALYLHYERMHRIMFVVYLEKIGRQYHPPSPNRKLRSELDHNDYRRVGISAHVEPICIRFVSLYPKDTIYYTRILLRDAIGSVKQQQLHDARRLRFE